MNFSREQIEANDAVICNKEINKFYVMGKNELSGNIKDASVLFYEDANGIAKDFQDLFQEKLIAVFLNDILKTGEISLKKDIMH